MDVKPMGKQRWVLTSVDTETVEAVKALSGTSELSMSGVVDLAVEYFSRKVVFVKDRPLRWDLPDDF
jgi:hypothetical protein